MSAAPREKPRRRIALILVLLAIILFTGYRATVYLVASFHVQAAHKALAKRDLAQARQHLDRCLRLTPADAEVVFLAARTARLAGDFDDARSRLVLYRRLGGLEELVELENVLAATQRGELTYFSYLVSCVENDHPEKVYILEALARGYLATYRVPMAEQCLLEWLKAEPDNPDALSLLGQTNEYARSKQEAIMYYRQALAVAPERDDIRERLARVLLEARRVAEAQTEFEHLRQRQGDRPALMLGLARCRRELDDVAEAGRLLHGLPDTTDVIRERGFVALQSGNLVEAEDRLRAAHRAFPFDRPTAYALFQCLELLGKNEQGQKVKADLDGIEKAQKRLDELTKQIGEEPRNADLRCQAGVIFLEHNQEAEGLRWLASAIQENPRHQQTYQTLADYHERTGRTKLAEHYRLQAQQCAATRIAP